MNWIYQTKDTEQLDSLKQTKQIPMCCLQETHLISKDIEAQNEGLEEDIQCKWKQSEDSNIRQNWI